MGCRRVSQASQRGRLRTVLGRREEQANGGDQQDEREDIGDPGEVGEQGKAAGDKEATQQDGAGDSPEEDSWLACGVDLEEAEEEKEEKRLSMESDSLMA